MPLNHTDPFGLWKRVDCDNGGQCWQAEDGDTWKTFAKATGISQGTLRGFFDGETIMSGQIFDVSGATDWGRAQRDQFITAQTEKWANIQPPMGGGLRIAGRAGGSLLSRVGSAVGRWLGFGKKGAGAAPALRQAYEAEVKALALKAAELKAAGHSVEQIAIQLHAERRALGVIYKDVTPPELLKTILERNVRTYGDELGPSIEWLRARGKSWEDIIKSASKPGGKDLDF